MNPFGTVPIFVSLTEEHDKKGRNKVALWTSFNVLIILLISFFLGKFILHFFGITLNSLKIAGGLIITSSGFALLTGEFNKHKGMKREKVQVDVMSRSEVSLTPLALPMIAGPGTISLLITYNQEYAALNDILNILLAILMSTVFIYFTLRSSVYVAKKLGASGINALSRIIGFIVITIGIEFISSAIINVINVLI